MKFYTATALALSSAALTNASTCKPNPNGNGDLKHWPKAAAATLNAMIKANAHKGAYACFDMDNTSWRWDIEESLIPYLDNKGVLTRELLDPILKPIPFNDTATQKESLYSYYNRLCDIDDDVCYPWAAQVFSGIPLKQLKVYVDELMALNTTIPTTYFEEGVLTKTNINPPIVFRGQAELYNTLMKNGIEVYVVTASSEDVVRMVAADPKYGYNAKPENVIGINNLLKNKATGAFTFPRKDVIAGTFNKTDYSNYEMTPYMMAPGTWKEGKWAAIQQYINMWKKPILVAGDTPSSDGPMLFHGVDVRRGGVHLWVNRKDKYMKQLEGMMHDYAAAQRAEDLEVTADKNWVIVKPEDIL